NIKAPHSPPDIYIRPQIHTSTLHSHSSTSRCTTLRTNNTHNRPTYSTNPQKWRHNNCHTSTPLQAYSTNPHTSPIPRAKNPATKSLSPTRPSNNKPSLTTKKKTIFTPQDPSEQETVSRCYHARALGFLVVREGRRR
ncbi:hypothetical protein BDV96DRAFT_682447, partial [Lophiotrema nucula]